MQCGCINCCLLWKLSKCQHAAHTTPTWTKPFLTCFTKIYCCAAIHGRIWMNNVPHESRLIMLTMHWNQSCYIFFRFWEIWSQTSVSFFNSHWTCTFSNFSQPQPLPNIPLNADSTPFRPDLNSSIVFLWQKFLNMIKNHDWYTKTKGTSNMMTVSSHITLTMS